MNRDQAERERDRLAARQPDSTWIVAQGEAGFRVLKVGLTPGPAAEGTAIAARPKPPTPDSPPPPSRQQVNPWWGIA